VRIRNEGRTRWATISVQIRNGCESDARSPGTTSYLDLLTCMEMSEEMKSGLKTGVQKK
jgi:hypothetical protein